MSLLGSEGIDKHYSQSTSISCHSVTVPPRFCHDTGVAKHCDFNPFHSGLQFLRFSLFVCPQEPAHTMADVYQGKKSKPDHLPLSTLGCDG